ncbi:choline-binding transcriptional repressor BetI [Limimaricola hongkongensis]|uniref:HTH-type transcriptional regulator BetI n=1 Tax=Limimaricola hongkongensis DSM 17492 TaxID=1122180 RepID=A0A017H9M0_9RHOB|nr:transcriptional regulator BetI [Limimaricola hongkongensis]EYD71005.1 HTH-type transcriptional regulator BetI [Limimaricola hongkongensis DSM 17492]
MPKLGMEPIRRAALVKATIEEIGAQGSLDVTVAQIARRAGMSSALAHHYFGNKERIFLAAMRHLLAEYSGEVRDALIAAKGDPRARVAAILRANFGPSNFRPEVIAAWLNFYVLARTSAPAARLLRIYHRRLRSNLAHDLRALLGPGAGDAAERLAALIDGMYLKQGLAGGPADGPAATRQLLAALELELK